MKKVGIIGGAGPLASALFYQTFIQESYLQALQVPEILLINYPFTRGLSMEEGEINEAVIEEELGYCIQSLELHQVGIGVIACNTLHRYLQLMPKTFITFISLPQIIVREALANSHKRLLLLATQNTCRFELYQHLDITLLYPPPNEQDLVDEIIDRILEGKVFKNDSILLSQMIARLGTSMNFDGVILGCTDLPVLQHYFPIHSSKPFYDSIKIPAKKLRGIL